MQMMGMKLQEQSPEREEAVYKIAKQKCKTDGKQWTPIVLELNKHHPDGFEISGFDVLLYTMVPTGNGGEMRDVRIEDRHVAFIEHEDYRGLIRVVAATEHNLDVLATHVDDSLWTMHTDDWVHEEVKARYTKIIPVRDVAAAHAAPEFQDTQMSPEEKMRLRMVELEKEKRELEIQLAIKNANENPVRETLGESLENKAEMPKPTKPTPEMPIQEVPAPGVPVPEIPVEPVPVAGPDEANTDMTMTAAEARKIVYEEHKEEIEAMREAGKKRPDLTKEFKAWMEETRKCIPQAR